MSLINHTHLKTALVAGIMVCLILIAGCTGNSNQSQSGSTTPDKTATYETLSITGSTTLLPIAQACAESYMKLDKYADIQVSGGGSSVGVMAIGEKTADVGMSSRDIKESEKTKYPTLIPHTVAKDAIVIIVSPTNTVSQISLENVKKIYSGSITNWNQIGGNDEEIVVVGRDSSSGTREFFTETVMGKENFVPTQLEKNSNGAIAQTIAQTPGAIGYVSLGYLDSTIKGLNIDIDGKLVQPTLENVLNGSYPISRSLYMLTNGEPTGLTKKYIDYLLSKDGQAIILNEGYVPVA